jgi:hypothetical protein
MSRVIDKDMGWSKIMREFGHDATNLEAYVGSDPQKITADTTTQKFGREHSHSAIDPETGKERKRYKYRGTLTTTTKGAREYYPLYLEFGTRKMAARPFMRWTLDAHDNYYPQLKSMAAWIFDDAISGKAGKSAARRLFKLANQVVKDIKYTIVGMGLIDTGRMYRSIKVLRMVSGGTSTGGSLHADWGNG